MRSAEFGVVMFVCTKCGRNLTSVGWHLNADTVLHLKGFTGTMHDPRFCDAFKKTITQYIEWHNECKQYIKFLQQIKAAQ